MTDLLTGDVQYVETEDGSLVVQVEYIQQEESFNEQFGCRQVTQKRLWRNAKFDDFKQLLQEKGGVRVQQEVRDEKVAKKRAKG